MGRNKGVIEISSLSRLEERKKILKQQNWVVDKIFEKGEIHVLCGASGVGKTTWLLQFIKDWAEGKSIFGLTSFPDQFVYIPCDRSMLVTTMTLERLGLGDWDVPMFVLDELEKELERTVSLEDIIDYNPKIKVFFIEALGRFEPTSSNKQMGYNQGMNYWASVRKKITDRGVTIFGTYHSPKSKGVDIYEHSRERMLGTVAGGASVASIVTLDFKKASNSLDMERVVTISPRNSPNMILSYKLDEHGRYIYSQVSEEEIIKATEKAIYILRKELERLKTKPGDILGLDAISGIRERCEISDAHMDRLLKELCDAKILHKIKRGTYRIEKHINKLVIN